MRPAATVAHVPRVAAPEQRTTQTRTSAWRLAAGVFVVALALRVMHLLLLRRAPFFNLLMGDALSYDQWAQRIAAGDWAGREVFYQAPLYPYLLGILYRAIGPSLTAAHVFHVLCGSAGCAFLTVAGVHLFGQRAGVVAGLLLAACGPALFFDGLLEKTSLDLVLFTALLLVIVRLLDGVTKTRAFAAGVLIGALALTRENALVFAPVLILWLAWRSRRVMPLLALSAGVAIALAPAIAHNFAVSGEFLPTTSQAGPNFYIGNHAGASGTYDPLRSDHGSAAYERSDAIEIAQDALGRALSPGEVSAYWWGRGLDWLRAHPAEWATLTVKKLLLAWNAEEATDTEDVHSHAEWSWPLSLAIRLGHFGVLAPVGLFGVWLTRARWRDLWVLYLMLAIYSVSVAFFYVLARYRYPLVPLLALFAGAAIAGIGDWWRSTPARQRWLPAALFALVIVLCNWPLLSTSAMRAITHYNMGVELQRQGRHGEAADEYRTTLALAPDYAPAHSNLGVVLAAGGAHQEAAEHYRAAMRLDPTLVEAQVNLGIALASAGHYPDAIEMLQQATRRAPRNAGAHYNLGLALAGANRLAEARQELDQTLALDPTNAAAHNNLGILLASTGHLAEGIAHFRAALTLQPDFAEALANLQHAQAELTPAH
jgi:tetratricopeptide (TPR) repeat protein